jgi:hypothetical protein
MTKKVQKDKQRSTKHAYKTKDQVTRPLPPHCSIDVSCCVLIVTNRVLTMKGERRMELVNRRTDIP